MNNLQQRTEQQLYILKNNNLNFLDKLTIFVNSPLYILFSFIIPIIYYFLLHIYTNNLLQNPNCNCIDNEYINNIKKLSFYMIIFQSIYIILKFFKSSPILIGINGIILLILLILVFSKWLKINKNINKKCLCAKTNQKFLISFISWTQIIFLIFAPIMSILFIILFIYNLNKK